MKVVYTIHPLLSQSKASIAAIGIFDGVHIGHQKILRRAVTLAKRKNVQSVAVTFYPHPMVLLNPEKFLGYIFSLEDRLKFIEQQGIDVCLVIPFSKEFSQYSSKKFVEDVLIKTLNVKHVVVGQDFHFGCGRVSGVKNLLQWGRLFNYQVDVLSIKRNKKHPVKSSCIRGLIKKGDFKKASILLGKTFFIAGKVIKGDGIGTTLGYPTANIETEHIVLPSSGVYMADVVYRKKTYQGLLYIGDRPTFYHRGNLKIVVEVHLLNFKGNLYGKNISVIPSEKIADSLKFLSSKDLILHIKRCVDIARQQSKSI